MAAAPAASRRREPRDAHRVCRPKRGERQGRENGGVLDPEAGCEEESAQEKPGRPPLLPPAEVAEQTSELVGGQGAIVLDRDACEVNRRHGRGDDYA